MTRLTLHSMLAVLAPLLIFAVALVGLGLLHAQPPPPSAYAGLLGVLLIAALLSHAFTRPLAADLSDIDALALAEPSAMSSAVTAHTVEAGALLDAVVLVRARSAELEAAAAEASREVHEAERLRVSFVAAMGHDLRGPLNAIMGFADLLAMEDHDAVAAAQRPSVDTIRQSAQDLLVLLEQILAWAMLEAGQVALDRQPASLHNVLAAAVSEARTRSADRKLEVELDSALDLPPVNADPQRLMQALLGLMDHATRTAGGPRIAIRTRLVPENAAHRARISIELHDPQLCIREADQNGFFEAFRPSYAPSGRRVAGLGLGPALARALIRAHGGQVSFTSQSDTGTVFSVELPLALQ